MVKHGYAVVVVERPGTGASFGKVNPSFEVVAKEVNEILNWIAAQEWSDGNIGMYGESWQGATQLAAASSGNPHLKGSLLLAVFIATVAYFRWYLGALVGGPADASASGQEGPSL